MAQWSLTDYSTGAAVEWSFPVNPNKFQHPQRLANVRQITSSSPQGGTIVFQGRDNPRKLSFSGLVNSETFYNELSAELYKYYPLELTDDQGSSWTILVENVTFERIRRALNQWRYDYSVTAIVLD